MERPKLSSILISDFNIENLKGYLNNSGNIEARTAPYGQVIPSLLSDEKADFAVVWTRPESVVPSFENLMRFEQKAGGKELFEAILGEVHAFALSVKDAAKRFGFVLIPTWTVPTWNRGSGILDFKQNVGMASVLAQMNLKFAEILSDCPSVFFLNTSKWIEKAGTTAFSPKLWYMGKIPFGPEVFKEAVQEIGAAVRAVRGEAKKLVLVDLDDTLWGGIVGDIGWSSLKIGGHDALGEAFVDFQKALKSLKQRGVLLGIVSKNEEKNVLEVFSKHSEMVLKLEDFAGWRINWEDKAKNIVDLVAELNLGLQSVVFIDDNPVERARVRDALPEVLVPEWPEDKMLYASTLARMNCFDTTFVTQEDASRTAMYVGERKRETERQKIGSLDEWLKTLELKVEVEALGHGNLQRVEQLLNKTNQMNLSTRRLSARELSKWATESQNRLWAFRVSDKFGDAGLTGIASVSVNGDEAKVVDFILSCRVMGRKIEETMLHIIVEHARKQGAKRVLAKYIPTEKNKPCLDFWKHSGFTQSSDHIYAWDSTKPYLCPDFVEVIK